MVVLGDKYNAWGQQYVGRFFTSQGENKGGFYIRFKLETIYLRACFKIFCLILRNWGLKEYLNTRFDWDANTLLIITDT